MCHPITYREYLADCPQQDEAAFARHAQRRSTNVKLEPEDVVQTAKRKLLMRTGVDQDTPGNWKTRTHWQINNVTLGQFRRRYNSEVSLEQDVPNYRRQVLDDLLEVPVKGKMERVKQKAGLTALVADAWYLKKVEGLTNQEIADRLEVEKTTINEALRRAYQKIKVAVDAGILAMEDL